MPTDPTGWTRRGLGVKLALVGAGIAAGAVIATAVGANAATSGSGSSSAPAQGGTPPSGQPMGPDSGRPFDHGGSAPVRTDEKTLGSALTAELKATALKAVPGATVYRIESDSGDGSYEAHMSKADGSLVTVKFDKAGTVTGVEQGMGK
jgi:hypothetical protein